MTLPIPLVGLDPTFNPNFTYYDNYFGTIASAAIGNGNWNSTRGVTPHTAGKWYLEVLVVQAHNFGSGQWDAVGIGIVNGSASPTVFPGQTNTTGFMCDLGNAANDFWYNGGKSSGYGGTPNSAPGNYIALAVDLDNAKVWFRDITRDAGTPHWWGASDNGADNPSTPSSGFAVASLVTGNVYYSLPLAYQGETGSALCNGIVNGGTSTFQGAVPSGFTGWDLTPVTPVSQLPVDTHRNKAYLRR